MYRIYDNKLAKNLQNIVELIKNKKWEKANELLDKVKINIQKNNEEVKKNYTTKIYKHDNEIEKDI